MPNWNARVEQELRSLDRLLSVTLTIESRFASAEWDLRAAVILRRIRRLYFREDGALGFLRRLAEGEPISEAERLRLRAQHDSFEAEMEDAAEALRVTARRNDIRIDMDAMALLEGLVNDSTTIRDTVHGMFDAPVGALVDTEASRRDARVILDALEPRLNRFREADIRLRMRARAHGVDLPGAETSPETTPETEAEEEAREAAEARAAFIGAPAPSPAADVADALSVRSGAPGRGLAETLRRMTARAEAEGRGAAAARGPDHGTDRRTHRGAEDWPEHRAEHGAERGGQGVDPNQRELDLDHPPRRASRAETARRRWATRRLPRAEGAGRDPVDLIPGAPGAPDGPGAGGRRVAARGAAQRARSGADPAPAGGRG
ncbi:MAG: hypothetical protein VX463_00635, partial [Pseudomonadota bacterium]|nr:hypothetical protein [Pseudomonadota bacterium]